MSALKQIEEQLRTLKQMQAVSPRHTGRDNLIRTLEVAKARMEHLEKAIDERLPTEAEIALQLLPAVMNAAPDLSFEQQSQEAFRLAETFLATKDLRK